jgi:hypothetical protein
MFIYLAITIITLSSLVEKVKSSVLPRLYIIALISKL